MLLFQNIFQYIRVLHWVSSYQWCGIFEFGKAKLYCLEIGLLITYINMFLFKNKQQKTAVNTQSQIDRKVQYLINESKTYASQSNLSMFYREVSWNPLQTWPQFPAKFQTEQHRIKKYQQTWNYSDISILQNSIKKSIVSETLSVIMQKWCQDMIYFLEPKLLKLETLGKVEVAENYRIIGREIFVFCQFCFKFVFKTYEFFFNKHYSQRSKSKNQQQLSLAEIYDKEKLVFQDFIRNQLTSLKCFQNIYGLIIESLFSKDGTEQTCLQTEQSFCNFLVESLQIRGKILQIFTGMASEIAQFYLQQSLTIKMQRLSKIKQAFDKDCLNYYKKVNKIPPKQGQTITQQVLHFLLHYFCPKIVSPIRYMKLMLCYRDQSDFKTMITQFYILWMDEDKAEAEMIFEVFQGIY